MKNNEAIKIIEYHQKWRTGKKDEMIYEPKQLTEALDIVLSLAKKGAASRCKRCNCLAIKDLEK
jgi:hypothetical protein